MELTDLFTPGVREGGTAGFQDGRRPTNLLAGNHDGVTSVALSLKFSAPSTNRDTVSPLMVWSNGFFAATHAQLERSPFRGRLH
jgi:hypothetical protein